MKKSIVTRNSQKSIDHFLKKLGFDYFSIKLTRDFIPFKPHPACR